MKKTMNKHDVAQYHKYLDEEIPLKKISEGMDISADTLKKFTPEVLKKVKEQHAEDASPTPVKKDK